MTANQTILDTLFGEHPVASQVQPVVVAPGDLAHVVGTQEPIRDQPDDRARALLTLGWLKIENVRAELPEAERAKVVAALQQTARAWLKQGATEDATAREQVRWINEKTRPYESKQQIAQRVWLAAVLYGLGHRGLAYDAEGQIHWQGGLAGRIGLAPDAVLDLAWGQRDHETYTASFRNPDGSITRGKGRHRWNVYRLSLNPAADALFKRRAQRVQERVALIVASETYATQPQLPRNFYGGNEFQQACIDAQDGQFNHILVLSPQHGVISLDDVVPGEQSWDEVLERRIWTWQLLALQRLGRYLFGSAAAAALTPQPREVNWWPWLNPESVYEITLFGQGFAPRILIDYLLRARMHQPESWPEIVVAETRPGYDVGDLDDESDYDYEESDIFGEEGDFQSALEDLDQLIEWASEFITLTNIYITPLGETWEIEAEDALIPVRLLAEAGMSFDELLDLLTDITLLLEQPLPFSLIISAHSVVTALLQAAHSITHGEIAQVMESLNPFPEGVLSRYLETALQEPDLEERLCACLTLAEQMQVLALTIPPDVNAQLVVWLQTYLSGRLRQTVMGKGQ